MKRRRPRGRSRARRRTWRWRSRDLRRQRRRQRQRWQFEQKETRTGAATTIQLNLKTIFSVEWIPTHIGLPPKHSSDPSLPRLSPPPPLPSYPHPHSRLRLLFFWPQIMFRIPDAGIVIFFCFREIISCILRRKRTTFGRIGHVYKS